MSSDKILFLHIPKTAGTSFRTLLEKEYPGPKQMPLYYPIPYGPELLEELRSRVPEAQVFVGHVFFGIDAELGFHARYVTFLRHPVARVYSYYLHNKRHENSPYFALIRDGMSLRDMLERAVPEVNNNMTRMISGIHDNSRLESWSVYEKAIQNLEQRFLFVGVTERFTESFRILSCLLNWRSNAVIPTLNRAPDDIREHLDESTLAAIERFNQLDLALYHYGEDRLNRELSDKEKGNVF